MDKTNDTDSGSINEYINGATNHALWTRIEQIVNNALMVRQTSHSIINTIIDKSTFDANLNQFIINNKMYRMVCGAYEPDSSVRTQLPEQKRLFWHCINATVNDQFGGFTTRNIEEYNYIKKRAFNDPGKIRHQFWKIDKTDSPARIWFIAAYIHIMRNEIQDKRALREVVKYIRNFFKHLELDKDLLSIRLSIALKLIQATLREFDENIVIKSGKEMGTNDGLIDYLHHLQRAGTSSCPVEIGLVMRALGGKYINVIPGCESHWRPAFETGIKYIIQKQSEQDGSWSTTTLPDTAGPLLHNYSPLLHLLDLDLDTLRPHLEFGLVNATERILRSMKERLDNVYGTLNEIKTSSKRDQKKTEIQGCLKSLFEGLSLGTMIYDRFKDLLSDSILNSMNAEEVLSCETEKIPVSLGFYDNIEKGVMKLWEAESIRRPGAIMIYGPPGTGKTTVAKNIAGWLYETAKKQHKDIRWRFLSLSPSDFAHEGSDGIVACAKHIFDQLKRVRRCVVLMDEMEEFLRARNSTSDRLSNMITTAFLPLLQEVINSREIILIIATNYVGRMDPAVVRRGRFDLILPLGPPDKETRKKIIEAIEGFREVQNRMTANTDIKTDKFSDMIVRYTMAYTISEINDFCLTLFESHLNERDYLKYISKAKFEMLLWRIRADNVPNALSNRAGCNWRVFYDETARYSRYSGSVGKPSKDQMEEYWREPDMPAWENRSIKKPS